MILEFSIENTYSIKERQTISFEAADDDDDRHVITVGGKKLLKLAAIYGANASGKSNVIKAFNFYIRFILDSFTDLKPHEKISFKPFFFTENPDQLSGFFEIVFYFENTWYKYQIRLNRKMVLNESLSVIENNDEKIIYHFNLFTNEREYTEEDEKLLQFVRSNATFLSTAANLNHTFLGNIYRYLKSLIVSLENIEFLDYTRDRLYNKQIKMGDINKLINKAGIDHAYSAIMEDQTIGEKTPPKFITGTMDKPEKTAQHLTDISYNREEIFFVHTYDKNYVLPFLSESMGTRRFFEIAGPLLDCIHHKKNMFIDEIESSLHDDLLDFFIRTFLENTKESQLLFTTHNQTLLDSELLRNDEIWFVQKDSNGASGLFSLAEFRDVPENVSRRDLYKAGAFGALPRTSRFFKE
ncbi:MAG: ATP-binding protein [Tannerella sp.]|jgi:AAA15 family ATPase/GTPase|nr:ATP-binding protein [Tannerella sp.]